jgi:hypothetical protein
MPAKKRSGAQVPEAGPGEEYSPGSVAIFELTPEDLRANQRGYLTDRQRGWLQGTARGIRGCSMASAPIAPGFVGNRRFSFTDDMSRAFREGAPYRVYYCKSGPYQLTMSFEELGA